MRIKIRSGNNPLGQASKLMENLLRVLLADTYSFHKEKYSQYSFRAWKVCYVVFYGLPRLYCDLVCVL